MTINILTLFPKMFESVFSDSIINRAKEKGIVQINIHNLRDWTNDKHKTVDDSPYGGGAGMVMKVDVIDRALHDLKIKNLKSEIRNKLKFSKNKNSKQISNFDSYASNYQGKLPYVVLLTPQGKKFNQKLAQKLSKKDQVILVCGHYEGFDERVRKLVDEQISIGDYVLTGGEIPAMVITDTIARLAPNVLGKSESHQIDSFSMENMVESKTIKSKIKNCLEYPQYTRPEKYSPVSKKFKNRLTVPKVLLGGNHEEIKKWRIDKSLNREK